VAKGLNLVIGQWYLFNGNKSRRGSGKEKIFSEDFLFEITLSSFLYNFEHMTHHYNFISNVYLNVSFERRVYGLYILHIDGYALLKPYLTIYCPPKPTLHYN